jgi:hypothetical protein
MYQGCLDRISQTRASTSRRREVWRRRRHSGGPSPGLFPWSVVIRNDVVNRCLSPDLFLVPRWVCQPSSPQNRCLGMRHCMLQDPSAVGPLASGATGGWGDIILPIADRRTLPWAFVKPERLCGLRMAACHGSRCPLTMEAGCRVSYYQR